MIKFTKQIKNKFHFEPIIVSVSIFISICIALLIYINIFQFPLLSKRNMVIALLITIFTTFFLLLIYKFWLKKIVNFLPKRKIIFLIIFSLITAAFFSLVLAFNSKPLFFLYPRHDIGIAFTIGNQKSSDAGVSLSYMHNDIRDVSFSELEIKGNYEIKKNEIYFPSGQSVSIKWNGIVGNNIFVSFLGTDFNQPVIINWNNSLYDQIQLNSKTKSVTAHHIFSPQIDEELITRIIIFPVAFLVTLVVLLGLFSALPYTFVMFFIWMVFLMTYWPGIIGEGNINAVNDLFANQLANWHPVLFTLILGALTKIFSTVSIFFIIQIFVLSLVLGWGFAFFEKLGVNKKILWAMTIVATFLPTNVLSMITLTNDIAFSIMLALLTIIAMKLFFSHGKWLEKTAHWVLLVLASLFAILFRYNGIPAVGFTLLVFLFSFPKQRKLILISSGIIVVMWVLINGPIYDLFGVQRISLGHVDNILLHHISAHVNAGTPLNNEEKKYLNSLNPLDEWDYSCCSNNSVRMSPGFDEKYLHQNPELNRQIALDLFLKAPLVEVKHILCASDVVWKITSECDLMHSSIYKKGGRYSWSKSYLPEYKDNSMLPLLVKPFSEFFILIENNPLLFTLFWRPAIYLYLSVIFTLIFYFRTKIKLVFMTLAPLLGQSAFLFLFNRTQNFRYQYCAIPICIILAGLVFIPLHRESTEASYY